MNCLEFRRVVLSDPRHANNAWEVHRLRCAGCRQFAEAMNRQDKLLGEAARIAVPEGFAARILLNQSLRSDGSASSRDTKKVALQKWSGVAMAAALFVAVGLFTFTKISGPSIDPAISSHNGAAIDDTSGSNHKIDYAADDLLTNEVFTHVAHHAMHADYATPVVTDLKLSEILDQIAPDANLDIHNVVIATRCIIDHQVVAHLLVRDEDNYYVVLLFPENVKLPHIITNDIWKGQVAFHQEKSIIVLSDSGQENLSSVTPNLGNQFLGGNANRI